MTGIALLLLGESERVGCLAKATIDGGGCVYVREGSQWTQVEDVHETKEEISVAPEGD